MSNARDTRERASKFWDKLSNEERWQIGDDLVLGCLDPLDWFDNMPDPGFLRELDRLRIQWEMING